LQELPGGALRLEEKITGGTKEKGENQRRPHPGHALALGHPRDPSPHEQIEREVVEPSGQEQGLFAKERGTIVWAVAWASPRQRGRRMRRAQVRRAAELA
jgi:hypothetical protein